MYISDQRSKTAKFWVFKVVYFDFPCEIFEILDELDVRVVSLGRNYKINNCWLTEITYTSEEALKKLSWT